MKELLLVYVLLMLVTTIGCTYTKTLYPTAEGDDPIVESTDGMVRVRLNEGTEYFASGFRIENDSLFLFPPISSEKQQFKLASDVIQQSGTNSRQTERLEARLIEMSLPIDTVKEIGRTGEPEKTLTTLAVIGGAVALFAVWLGSTGGLFSD